LILIVLVAAAAAAAAAVDFFVFESRYGIFPFFLPILLRSFLFPLFVTVGVLHGDGERRVAGLCMELGRKREKGREGGREGGKEGGKRRSEAATCYRKVTVRACVRGKSD